VSLAHGNLPHANNFIAPVIGCTTANSLGLAKYSVLAKIHQVKVWPNVDSESANRIICGRDKFRARPKTPRPMDSTAVGLFRFFGGSPLIAAFVSERTTSLHRASGMEPYLWARGTAQAANFGKSPDREAQNLQRRLSCSGSDQRGTRLHRRGFRLGARWSLARPTDHSYRSNNRWATRCQLVPDCSGYSPRPKRRSRPFTSCGNSLHTSATPRYWRFRFHPPLHERDALGAARTLPHQQTTPAATHTLFVIGMTTPIAAMTAPIRKHRAAEIPSDGPSATPMV